MHTLTILAGQDKSGAPEGFDALTLQTGTLYTVVGNTGSGKSRLIKDVEQLADGDSATGRRVLIDGTPVDRRQRQRLSAGLMAHLSQNMRFILDTTVAEFLALHARCRQKDIDINAVIALADSITPEAVPPAQNLNLLSGGQTRALMIAEHFARNPKDNPLLLTVMALFGQFKELFVVNYLRWLARHKGRPFPPDTELMRILRKNNTFVIGEIKQNAAGWDNRKVFNILGLLREYDAKSKGLGAGGASDGELLRELLLKIFLL